MHTTRTFILRLFIDPDARQTLRGSIQALTEKKSHPFVSQEKLAALLQELVDGDEVHCGDEGRLTPSHSARRPERRSQQATHH